MEKTITLKNAKELYQIAEEKKVKLISAVNSYINENDSIEEKYELHKREYLPGGAEIYGYPAYTTNELLKWLPSDFCADTPQDALCLLAIELIKQDIIK